MTDDARNAFSTVAPFGTGAFGLMRLTGSGLHPRLLGLLEARAAAGPEAAKERVSGGPRLVEGAARELRPEALADGFGPLGGMHG
jgi:hypothetical protein